MTTYIALLRGINVGGNKKVAMADLRELATKLGLANAQTLLQSGNLVFKAAAQKPAQLETSLEAALKKRLDLECSVLVRTAAEWDAIVARNPFPAEAKKGPSHMLVMCLKQAPDPAAFKALRAAIVGREMVRGDGRQAYLVYSDGIAESRLTNAFIEKTLGTRGSARNWNTVLKLAAATRA